MSSLLLLATSGALDISAGCLRGLCRLVGRPARAMVAVAAYGPPEAGAVVPRVSPMDGISL